MASQDFNFNGRNASEFGIRIERYRSLSRPSRKFHASSVPGRNGNVYTLENNWEESELTYEVYATDNTADASTTMADIMEWLTEPSGYAVLTDTYDPEHYRMAMLVDATDIENVYNKYGRARLTFRCLPERFLVTSDIEVEWSSNQYTLENPTNHNSKPIINFTGYFLSTMLGTIGRHLVNLNSTGGAVSFTNLQTANNYPFEEVYYKGISYDASVYATVEISNSSFTNNSLTFTAVQANYGFGFPLNIDPNTNYSFIYDVSGGVLFRIFEYTENGTFIREINPSISSGAFLIKTSQTAGYVMMVFYSETANVEVSADWFMFAEGDHLPVRDAFDTSFPVPITWNKILTVGANSLYATRKFNNVTIDTENEMVYNNGVNINRYVKIVNDGKNGYNFLNLLPGDNLIKRVINSTVATATIIPRFWEI